MLAGKKISTLSIYYSIVCPGSIMTTICSKGQKLKSSYFNVHKLQTADNLVFSSFFICCFKEYCFSLILGGWMGWCGFLQAMKQTANNQIDRQCDLVKQIPSYNVFLWMWKSRRISLSYSPIKARKSGNSLWKKFQYTFLQSIIHQ